MAMKKLVPAEADAVVAAARHFSFPPPRTTSGGGESCRKMAAAQVDLGAAAMGSWLDSMKTSSPRHRLVDAEHDDWMVRTSCLRVVVHVGRGGLFQTRAPC
jgi:trehalose 6-phosphate phosphatase